MHGEALSVYIEPRVTARAVKSRPLEWEGLSANTEFWRGIHRKMITWKTDKGHEDNINTD